MIDFLFNPPDGLRDEGTYPTNPSSEQEARGMFQEPLDQIKTFINTNIKTELQNAVSTFDSAKNTLKFENGFMVAWGSGVLSTGAYSGDLTINFGQAFSQVPNVIVSLHDAGTSLDATSKDVTTSNFVARVRSSVPSGGNGVGIGAVRVVYVALGRWK